MQFKVNDSVRIGENFRGHYPELVGSPGIISEVFDDFSAEVTLANPVSISDSGRYFVVIKVCAYFEDLEHNQEQANA